MFKDIVSEVSVFFYRQYLQYTVRQWMNLPSVCISIYLTRLCS